MAATAFEISGLSPGTVTGTCELFEGASALGQAEVPTVGSGFASNNLLQADQDLIVRVIWNSIPPDAGFLLGGTWRLEVVAEQVGGGVATQSIPPVVPVVGALQRDLIFPTPTLAVGYHRIIMSMQWFDFAGNPGPLAGFVDLGVIKVYQEP